ncbi:MAG: lytic transglycosylase domain-containing protein [Candidatus Eremiobacteraeota bacterium]|nr:lytic transglycosylase domain-containing protein [Candidatus Eremiobacteraeota bacterium]
MFATLVLAQLLRDCASHVDRRTMAAVVRVESGGNTLALHDNTSSRSFAPAGIAEGAAWASELVAMGHSVDIGLSQINSANLPKLGLSVADAFVPCTNLRAGAAILGGDYVAAAQRFGPGQVALRHALGAYNTGSLFAGQGYINRILVAAGLSAEYAGVPAVPVETAPLGRAISYRARRSYTTRRVPGSTVEVIVGNP